MVIRARKKKICFQKGVKDYENILLTRNCLLSIERSDSSLRLLYKYFLTPTSLSFLPPVLKNPNLQLDPTQLF